MAVDDDRLEQLRGFDLDAVHASEGMNGPAALSTARHRDTAEALGELLSRREQSRRSRSERASGVRAAAARVREAHDTWLDVSEMGSLSFGILLGVRNSVDAISTGLEGYAVEIEKGETDGHQK